MDNFKAKSDLPEINWKNVDVPVEREGKKIILPKLPGPMDYDSAIARLEQIKKDENQEYEIMEVVPGAPWDALAAVYRAVSEIYGVVSPVSTPGFFGPKPPQMIDIKVGHRDTDVVMCPMGAILLPNFPKPVNIELDRRGCLIYGNFKPAEKKTILEISAAAKKILRTSSIYKGKSIRLSVDDDGNLVLTKQPEFLNLDGVTEDDMVHTAETTSQIAVNILGPLKHTEACRRHRIPLKRSILLEGRYGTGKTLTARVAAKVANDNGWSFIILDRPQGLKAALELARIYQPCAIFAEDIDRVGDREEESVNDLINLMDGIVSKDSEIITILTTNFVEKIDKAMLRPGRLDSVISIQEPDFLTVKRLIERYSAGLLAPDADIDEAASVMIGEIPATIREMVEKSKVSMLMENRSELRQFDLLTAAQGMRRHLELLRPKEDERSVGDRFVEVLREVVAEAAQGLSEETLSMLQVTADDADKAERYSRQAAETLNAVHRIAKEGAGSAAEAAEAGKTLVSRLKAK